ncbi:MAG: enoyl-CoA hydratase/isomerase family protein [Thermomicrobiales bacterium]|nr:enoyl-CoA hydratase/isomerase family protein [Thermomicrobiales bacterium]
MSDAVDRRVALERDGAVATIRLDRPEKLNALDPAMLARLDALLAELDRDPQTRVVILTGAGAKAFCVGADVTVWAALEPLEMWRIWVREGHRVFDRLAGLRQPTIAALNGYAFGGGLELALAADLRIMAAETEVAMPETTIATLPGWAGTRRLPALIGPARAKQMIFSGERIGAERAERWGLVNEIAPRAALLDRTRALAEAIAANAPISVQLAKAAIDDRPDALEALAGALAAGSDDGREGVAAFREKRLPTFRGR